MEDKKPSEETTTIEDQMQEACEGSLMDAQFYGSEGMAAEGLVAEMMSVIVKCLENQKKPWSELKETEQANMIDRMKDECEKFVMDAVGALIADEWPAVNATLEKVAFGKGVAISISASDREENILKLAKHRNKPVSIVMVHEKYGLDMAGVPTADKDQKDLVPDEEKDPVYDEAVKFVLEEQKASISSVQRKIRIGYNRAARIIEQMERDGFVSEMNSSGQREILMFIDDGGVLLYHEGKEPVSVEEIEEAIEEALEDVENEVENESEEET